MSGVSRPGLEKAHKMYILRRCVPPWCAPYLGCKENSCHCQALSGLSDLSGCQAVRACQAGLDTHDTRRAWLLSRTPDTSLTLALASPTFYVSGLSRLSDNCQQLSGSAVRTVKPRGLNGLSSPELASLQPPHNLPTDLARYRLSSPELALATRPSAPPNGSRCGPARFYVLN